MSKCALNIDFLLCKVSAHHKNENKINRKWSLTRQNESKRRWSRKTKKLHPRELSPAVYTYAADPGKTRPACTKLVYSSSPSTTTKFESERAWRRSLYGSYSASLWKARAASRSGHSRTINLDGVQSPSSTSSHDSQAIRVESKFCSILGHPHQSLITVLNRCRVRILWS